MNSSASSASSISAVAAGMSSSAQGSCSFMCTCTGRPSGQGDSNSEVGSVPR